MRRTAAILFVSAIFGAAACSGDDSSSPTSTPGTTAASTTSGSSDTAPATTTAPGDTAAATTAPAVTGPPTTLVPPDPLPAGAQFGRAPLQVPAGTAQVIRRGDGWVGVGSQPNSDVSVCPGGTDCGRVAGNPFVYVSPEGSVFPAQQIDDITTVTPPGGFTAPTGLTPLTVAANDTGIVVGGQYSAWDSLRFLDVSVRGMLWFSADGVEWQRIDLRDVVGDTNSSINGVYATENGFVAVGEIAGASLSDGPSRGLVLTSPDGVAWAPVEVALPYAVDLSEVHAVGDRLLLSGVEYVCTEDAGAMNSFSVGAQTRLWTSDDGGATWSPVDLVATGVADDQPDIPASPDACPEFSERSGLQWGLGLVDAAAGRFVLASSDGSRAATSEDATTWTVADLPDGLPAASESTVPAPVRVAVADGDELAIVSLEAPRDEAGVPRGFGLQGRSWRSTDGGTAWTANVLPKPMAVSRVRRVETTPDGLVVLTADTGVTNGTVQSTLVLVSEAGPAQDWGSCQPAPNADCSFVTFADGTDLSGADLTKVDFTGADLTNVNFSGANLIGSRFEGATLSGAVFTNAGLERTLMRGQYLALTDLTGARLDGADLRGAALPGSLLTTGTLPDVDFTDVSVVFTEAATVDGVDLSGRTLAGLSLRGAFEGVVKLPGAKFDGADLRKVRIDGIDLTGATFVGAQFGTVEGGDAIQFGSDVICPDGDPPTPDAGAGAACRL